MTFAAAVAAAYAVAGTGWIWFSDRALLAMGLDAGSLTLAQSYKGWVFVVLTALGLYFVLRARASHRAKVEARFRSLTESSTDLVAVLNSAGRITFVGPSVERTLGFLPAEMVGKSVGDFIHPDDLASGLKALSGAMTSPGEVYCVAYRVRHRDGSWRFHEATGRAMVAPEGGMEVVLIGRDVTERIQAEERIRDLNRMYATLSQTNKLMIRVTDQVTLYRELCRVAVEHGGVALAWVGLLDPDNATEVTPFTHYGDAADYLEKVRVSADASHPQSHGPTGTAVREGRVVTMECTDNEADECRREAVRRGFHAAAALPLKLQGKVIGSFTMYAEKPGLFAGEGLVLLEEMAADIAFALDNIRQQAERLRSDAELRKLSQALEQSANVVFITDRQGMIEYVNPKFTETTGFTSEQAVGRNARFLTARGPSRSLYMEMWKAVSAGDEWHGEVRNRAHDGSLGWCMLSVAPVCNPSGEVTNFVVAAEDISECKAAQALAEHLAFYDSTTELPNRALFADRLAQAAAAARRNGRTLGVMFMDLDRFKQVNDSLGHAAGDRLLQQVGERLKACVRRDDTVARMGGDEFTVLLSHLARPGDAGLVAEKILDAFREPFRVGAHEVFSSPSIGITICPDDGDDYETLMRNADAAMYKAKERGAAYHFFTPEIHAAAGHRLQMENSLRHGLDQGEFRVYYQPQVHLATGKVVGAEALVRWLHPERGLVPPAQFIPLAEDTGLIVPLGEFVLDQACQDARAWERFAEGGLRVAVNLSARQFWHGNILKSVKDALARSGLDPRNLEVELTESIIMKDAERTVATLRELKDVGIAISIDDFGTGYSSLNYLKRFPIDKLKIDQSFVRDVAANSDDAAIVTAVIAMAQQLRLRVIAEGVETEDQRSFLLDHGCSEAQGYLFSPPVPVQEFLDLLERNSRGAG